MRYDYDHMITYNDDFQVTKGGNEKSPNYFIRTCYMGKFIQNGGNSWSTAMETPGESSPGQTADVEFGMTHDLYVSTMFGG